MMKGSIKFTVIEDEQKVLTEVDCDLKDKSLQGKVALFKAMYATLEVDPVELLIILTELTGVVTGNSSLGKRFYKHKETGAVLDAEFFDKLRDL